MEEKMERERERERKIGKESLRQKNEQIDSNAYEQKNVDEEKER